MATAYPGAQPQLPNLLQPPTDLIRKRRKLATRAIPDTVIREFRDNGITDADLYEQLVEREHKLDWITQRKRIELQDGLQKVIRTRRTLRVFISHTCSSQSWQITETSAPPNFETGDGVPSWTLRIQGRLLGPEPTAAEQPIVDTISASTPKFSTLLKAMRVEIERDPTLYPESNVVEWHSNTQEQPVHGFNITRRGDQPSTRIRIMLHLAPNDPSLVRFKLSQPLSALLDMTSATRPDAISAMWTYVRAHSLFDKVDRRKVRSDNGLRTVAGADSFDFHHIPEIVTRHLLHPEPVVLDYQLTLDAGNPSPTPKAFDIPVDIDDAPLKSKLQEAYTAITQGDTAEIQALDEKTTQIISQINALSLKREFCKSYAADPQKFIHRWMASQARDLDVILGEWDLKPEPSNQRLIAAISFPTGQGGMAGTGNAKPQPNLGDEELRRSEFFRLPWVREAIGVYEGGRHRIPDGATR